ncbi:MAG: hypothetical protein WC310_02280 [Patescibacteria group bacterium]|jgi:hypothetical protein
MTDEDTQAIPRADCYDPKKWRDLKNRARKHENAKIDWAAIEQAVKQTVPEIKKLVDDFLVANPGWKVSFFCLDLPPRIEICFALDCEARQKRETVVSSQLGVIARKISPDETDMVATFVAQIMTKIGFKVKRISHVSLTEILEYRIHPEYGKFTKTPVATT